MPLDLSQSRVHPRYLLKYPSFLVNFSHCECGEGIYQFQTPHGRELVLLVRDAMRKLSLKRREQEEKLQEMRAMRKLHLSMRTESDPCLQHKLRMRQQQSVDGDQEKRHSQEDLPTG